MSGARRLATLIADIAARLARGRSARWGEAMRAEVAAADDDRAALAWACGCLAAAAGWALRAEAGYLLLLGVALAGLWRVEATLLVKWMRDAHPTTGVQIGDEMGLIEFTGAALAAAALVGFRPRRVLASIVGVGIASQWPIIGFLGAFMLPGLLAQPLAGAASNHPHVPNIVMAAWFCAMALGPSLLGASSGGLVAWGLARRQLRRS